MDSSRQSTLRTPIIVLAIIDLALLGVRLWPWPNVMSLPGNGATGIDPAVSLVAYAGLAFWVGDPREESNRKALFSAGWLGVVAGAFLMAQVVVAAQIAAEDALSAPDRIQIGLLGCAAVVIGVAGLRAARAGHKTGFSVVCAL